MPRTIEEIISKLNEMTAPPTAIAASTNPPSQAELRQAENFISGLRSAIDSAVDRPKAEKMLSVALQSASAHGVGHSAIGSYNRSQSDQLAYWQGQLMIFEQAGCTDLREEIRIRDNVRSLRGTR